MTLRSRLKVLELAGGIAGWIWLLSIPLTLWFLATALFSDAPWSRFFVVLVIGAVCKSLLRSLEANKNRMVSEAGLIATNAPPLADALTPLDVERERFWNKAVSPPPVFAFDAVAMRLDEAERRATAEKAQALLGLCGDLIKSRGEVIAERERRKYAILLATNYEAELRGDFSGASDKTRDTVITLLAMGLAFETLLKGSGHAALLAKELPTPS